MPFTADEIENIKAFYKLRDTIAQILGKHPTPMQFTDIVWAIQQHVHVKLLNLDTGSSSFTLPKQFRLSEISALVGRAKFVANSAGQTTLDKEGFALAAYRQSHPHEGLIDSLNDFLHAQHYLHSKITLHGGTVQYGNGTTDVFNFFIKHLIIRNAKENDGVGDAIIMPAPTYGLFAKNIYREGGQVVYLPLSSDNDFHVAPAALDALIAKTNAEYLDEYRKKAKLYIAQLEERCELVGINLDNTIHEDIAVFRSLVTNCIHDLTSKELDEFILKINSHVQELAQAANVALHDIPLLPIVKRVRGFFFANPDNPYGVVHSQEEADEIAKVLLKHRVVGIYDAVFTELIFDGTKSGSLLNCKQLYDENLVVGLFGTSKAYCVAGNRLGVIVGPKTLMEPIVRHDLLDSSSHLSIFAEWLFFLWLTMDEAVRQSYLKEHAEHLQFRCHALQHLLGLNHMQGDEELTPLFEFLLPKGHTRADSDLFKLVFTQLLPIFGHLPGVEVHVQPQSGYTLILDFSGWLGCYVGERELKNCWDIYALLASNGAISTIPGVMMGSDKPIMRVSYTVPGKEMLHAALGFYQVAAVLRRNPQPLAAASVEEHWGDRYRDGLLIDFVFRVQKPLNSMLARFPYDSVRREAIDEIRQSLQHKDEPVRAFECAFVRHMGLLDAKVVAGVVSELWQYYPRHIVTTRNINAINVITFDAKAKYLLWAPIEAEFAVLKKNHAQSNNFFKAYVQHFVCIQRSIKKQDAETLLNGLLPLKTSPHQQLKEFAIWAEARLQIHNLFLQHQSELDDFAKLSEEERSGLTASS